MFLFSSRKTFLNVFKPFLNNFRQFSARKMANSKFEYVREFEQEDKLLQNTWIVVRIDGQHFHKFSQKHNFAKPNDLRAIKLMNRAAMRVMCEFKDISIAYGQSDEYSFVLRKDTQLYNRRASKIMTYINSLFSSSYVYYWNEYFGDAKLFYPPSFDSRVVLYPTEQNLRDYLSWRQADCHINNLYNTTFWNLVLKGGSTTQQAEQTLCGTFTSDKNEILFSQFGINYNNEPEIFKKGTILLRKKIATPQSGKRKQVVLPLHIDLIQDKFWNENHEILSITKPEFYHWPGGAELPKEVLMQLHIASDKDDKGCGDVEALSDTDSDVVSEQIVENK